jgi:uncharacterized membrane protein
MWATLWLLLVVLSAGATWAWAVREQAIAFMTIASTASWSLLAVTGSTIELYHQDGTMTELSEPAIQYFFAGIALLSFFAFVLWYFGQYPVTGADESDSPPDTIGQDGQPTSEGV